MSKTHPAGMPTRTRDPLKARRLTHLLVVALASALVLVWGAPASAQQGKCLAGKTKCMSKKAAGLLKCEGAAETPGKDPDPNAGGCVTKVEDKFDGGADPAKGCFEKLENKAGNDCITFNDTATAESAVDSCVASLVSAIDPPPLTQRKCGAGKKKCISKYLKAILKCRALAQTLGKDPNPNAGGCLDKAEDKYDGGAVPSKGCFAKLEAVVGHDCDILGDSSTVQGLADQCDADLLAVVAATTSTTSTSTSSTTSTTCPATATTIQGALTATPGRFNYNLTLGLPGANAACNSNFQCSHACTYAELQTAETAGELVGLQDTGANTVTSFWAIDNSASPLQQCQDDAMGGSLLNWEYGTAHTVSRGSKVSLTNGTGVLGSLTTGLQCNFSGNAWVGCCR